MTTMTEFFWMAIIFVLLPAKSPALHLRPLTLALLAALKWFCIVSIESIPTIIIKFMYSTITHISHHITIWFVSNSSGQIPGRAIGRKPKNTQLSKALAAWRTGHGVLAGLSRVRICAQDLQLLHYPSAMKSKSKNMRSDLILAKCPSTALHTSFWPFKA